MVSYAAAIKLSSWWNVAINNQIHAFRELHHYHGISKEIGAKMKRKEVVGEDDSLPGEITAKLDSLTAADLLTVLTVRNLSVSVAMEPEYCGCRWLLNIGLGPE